MTLFRTRLASASAALCLFGFGIVTALATTAPSHAAPVEDLPNFHKVAPGIYRGGVPTEAGLKKLKAMGVRTVIDLRISPKRVKKEGETARQLGFDWLNLPMGGDPPTKKQVAQLLTTLDGASPARPVFVHCEHGADRTGCMIGIWRVTRQGWTFPQTWAEMRQYGFNPHWKKLTEAVQQRVPVRKAATK